MDAKVKPCPFCGEEILAVAIKCKHCKSDLTKGGNPQQVIVSGKDPFAEYHSDIQGKKKGKITVIGWLGIGIGALMMFASFSMCGDARSEADGMGVYYFFLMGLAFTAGSYLWARR